MFGDVAVMVFRAGIGIHVALDPCTETSPGGLVLGKCMKLCPPPRIVISTDKNLDIPRVGVFFPFISHIAGPSCTNDPRVVGAVLCLFLRRLTTSRITTSLPLSPSSPSLWTVEPKSYIAVSRKEIV